MKPANECYVGLKATKEYCHATEAIVLDIAKNNKDVHVIDPKKFMYDALMLKEMIAYLDGNPVTASFAKAIANQFTQELRWLANEMALSESSK